MGLGMGTRPISEGRLIEETGIDRLELYLILAADRLGQYDSVSHLLYFTEEEADAIAAQLGIPRKKKLPITALGEAIPSPGKEE